MPHLCCNSRNYFIFPYTKTKSIVSLLIIWTQIARAPSAAIRLRFASIARRSQLKFRYYCQRQQKAKTTNCHFRKSNVYCMRNGCIWKHKQTYAIYTLFFTSSHFYWSFHPTKVYAFNYILPHSGDGGGGGGGGRGDIVVHREEKTEMSFSFLLQLWRFIWQQIAYITIYRRQCKLWDLSIHV